MRPISLEFTAFGSYPGTQTVDFTSLEELGLYVVTGPTGSGKTTIFDAMAFALYGKLPGWREPEDVRSQHAPASALCSVTFRFEVDGVTYRVERTPKQWKPREKGTGDPVEKPQTASMVRESDGEPMAAKTSTVTAECQRLVGLDLSQFERVVLLPQGQFQQFLLASSTDRLPLLRQLFDTAGWDTVVRRLKDRADSAWAEVQDADTELDHHRRNAVSNIDAIEAHLTGADTDDDVAPNDDPADEIDLDDVGRRIDDLHARIEPKRIAATDATTAASSAEGEAATARSDADRFDREVVLTERLDVLTGAAPEIEVSRASIGAHDAAVPVVIADQAHRAAIAAAETAAGERDTLEATLRNELVRTAIETSTPVAELAGVLSTELERQGRRLESVDRLRSARIDRSDAESALGELDDEVEALRHERDTIEGRSAEITTALGPASERAERVPALQMDIDQRTLVIGRRQDLDRSLESIAGLQIAADEAAATQRALTSRFIATTAPRLAEELVDGEPCAVCGSTVHPTPATGSSDDVSSAELNDAAEQATIAATALRSAVTESGRLRDELGDVVDIEVADLEEALERVGDSLRLAEAARSEVSNLRAETGRLDARRGEIDGRLVQIADERSKFATAVDVARSKIDDAAAQLGADASKAADDPEGTAREIEAMIEGLQEIDDLRRSLAEAEGVISVRSGAVDERAEDLRRAIDASPFDSVETAASATLADDLAADLRLAIVEHDDEVGRLTTALEEIRTIPVSKFRPDVDALTERAARLRAISDELAADVARITDRLEQAERDLEDARRLELDSRAVRDRHTHSRGLHETASGRNARKMVLETWVLAGELDRVTTAANHHLVRMSGGRYRLQRSEVIGGNALRGLDLAVLDSHTGQARRPASLSGGEQFQASLSLALGLAEVIGHGGRAAGRTFTSLFVDEGFGSLDPDALDQAIDALADLRSGGRTVGVITHVEGMKDSLPLGIRVERLPDGRGSTLVVRPND